MSNRSDEDERRREEIYDLGTGRSPAAGEVPRVATEASVLWGASLSLSPAAVDGLAERAESALSLPSSADSSLSPRPSDHGVSAGAARGLPGNSGQGTRDERLGAHHSGRGATLASCGSLSPRTEQALAVAGLMERAKGQKEAAEPLNARAIAAAVVSARSKVRLERRQPEDSVRHSLSSTAPSIDMDLAQPEVPAAPLPPHSHAARPHTAHAAALRRGRDKSASHRARHAVEAPPAPAPNLTAPLSPPRCATTSPQLLTADAGGHAREALVALEPDPGEVTASCASGRTGIGELAQHADLLGSGADKRVRISPKQPSGLLLGLSVPCGDGCAVHSAAESEAPPSLVHVSPLDPAVTAHSLSGAGSAALAKVRDPGIPFLVLPLSPLQSTAPWCA